MTEFMGYVRPDGSVGVRNHLLILSGTVYANGICQRVADHIYGGVAITHPLGRCQVRPDLMMTRQILSNTGINPNVGAVVVIDHYREEGATAYDIADDIQQATGKPVAVVNIRGEGGLVSATEKALRHAADLRADAQRYAP
jgi:altronate dehydratase large subunit